MLDRYICPACTQVDGSTYQHVNCVFAVAVMLIDSATLGRIRVTPDALRRASRDTSGGVSYGQAIDAAIIVTNGQVVLNADYAVRRGDVRDSLVSGERLGLSYAASVTRPYPAYRTNYYTGPHSGMFADYDWREAGECHCKGPEIGHAHAEGYFEDPGTRVAGWGWVPMDLFYRAAEVRNGGSPGSSTINILRCRDTEGVKRRAISPGWLRALPSASSPRRGPIIVNHDYPTVRTDNGARWPRPPGSTVGYSNGWAKTADGPWIQGGKVR